MKKKLGSRIIAAVLTLAMAGSLCVTAPAMAAEADNGVRGSITAVVRIDYAQRLDELRRRGVQVELKKDGKRLGSVGLTEEGSFAVGVYPAQVTARNTDGGELLGGLWPGFLEVSFGELPQGKYELTFTGKGYRTYTETLTMDQHALHLTVGTGDKTFTLGDVNGDGKVDAADRTAISRVLGSTRKEDLLQYDLSGEGVIDIVDLAYVDRLTTAAGGAELQETALLTLPVNQAEMAAEIAKTGVQLTGDLSDIFADNGAGVKLTPKSGEDVILPLPLDRQVETQEIRVFSPAEDGAVLAGTMLVELASGGTETFPFDNTPPQGIHATARAAGSSVITVDLGRQVAVKKVTITVTKTKGGFAAVDSVQFLKDIVPEVPVAPNSVVKKVSTQPGSEMVSLSWNELPNVSGYKVLCWPESDVREVKELHVDVSSAKVTGLKNLETYVFTVTPTDGSWEGKPSAPVTATPQPASVPDKVDMVTVTAMDAALGVSWKEGKSATYYEVYYQAKGDGQWLQAGGKLTDIRTTITGLTNDVTYSVYVVAGNDVGKGPRSALYEGTPKAVKYERPEGIPTKGIMDNANISDIRLADAGNHTAGAFDPKSMIDNDYKTAWTAQNWWRNEHVVTTFAQPVDLNAAIWVPRLDSSYASNLRAYSVRVWYDGEDLSGAGHLIVPDPQAGGIDNGGTGRDVDTWPGVRGNAAVTKFAILPFGPVENVKKISVAIEQQAYTTISLSELMFMEYDPAHSLPAEIDALFADALHTQLKTGVTKETVDALQARLQSDERNYYYDLNTMADEVKLAGELLESGRSSGILLQGLDSRSGSPDSAKYSQGGSVLQPLGITVGAKQEITVYAEGIPAGETVSLVATQFNAEASQWQASLGNLENGTNVLTVPQIGSRSGNNGGSLYVTYSGNSGENIRLHIRRGMDIPVLELAHWYTMSEPQRRTAIGAYVDELDGYLAGFKMGSATQDYRNVTEISTPVALLSLPAQAVKNALGAGDREEKITTLYNSILAWEDIMAICKRTQGIDKVYAENDMQTRQNVRCMTMFAGAFMYAAGNHIGIGYGSCGGMVTGRPISLLGENAEANQLFGWGIAHEIGHNMDKLGKAEITNNIYSIMVQTFDGKAATLPSRLEKSGKYPDIFTKVAQSWPGASNDVFIQLGMYWQLHLAYDDGTDPLGFYNRFFKAWKAGTYTAGASGYDDKVALTAAGVAQRDLSEFFTRWGMTLSESTKETLSKYAKESRALWYLSDQSRREIIAGTAAATGTVKASAVLSAGKGNEITVTIDPSDIVGTLQGYEIRRNGTSIAFVPAGKEGAVIYTDVIGSGNHRLYAYEVIAYDILGNQVGGAAEAGEVRVAYDKTVDPSKYTITLKSGTATIKLSEETAVSGLKLDGVTPGVGSYTVTVADEEGKSSEALKSTFAAEDNQAVDDKDSYLAYFKMPGAESTDSRIWTYDAKTVTITGIPAGVQAESIRLITYPGDDVAFLEGGTMGLLAEDYHYTALNEAGEEKEEVIPKGTLVVLGTYRGDPVYNTLMVMGRYTGTASGENGEMEETAVVERAMAGYAFLFAEIPAVGEVSDISDGIFLFVPDVQREAQLQDESSHCDVTNLLPSQIRVDFFRTDTPNDTSSKRLTAQTMWLHSPGGAQEDLPTVVLKGGQGK